MALEFAPRVIDQPADELAIVLAGDDREGASLADVARAGWQEVGHAGGQVSVGAGAAQAISGSSAERLEQRRDPSAVRISR